MRNSFLLPALLATCAAAPGLAQSAPPAASAAPIDKARLSDDTRILASDAFEGRGPGTAGEDRAVEWIVARFKALGLTPAGDKGGWTQAVPLLHTRLDTAAPVSVHAGSSDMTLVQGKDIYLGTVRDVDRATIAAAPLVFVGYGVNAPERQWDDFKQVDLKGKVAVFLVNDPDFNAPAGDPVIGVFGGQAMTYYGRWTYKFDEAAKRGAIGILIVHDSAGAGYGWNTVIAPGGESFAVVRKPGATEPTMLQGWLSADAATRLFSAAGLDLAQLSRAARRRDFQPVALPGATLSADIAVTRDRVASRNVLAKLPGTTRPQETISFAAHWDAYGIGKVPGANGRLIRAGAADDAIGVAAVLELARDFAAAPRTKRTLLFAAWSAEERGLLGSETFAQSNLFPARDMVANYTMDVLQTAGAARDVVLVGAGQNELEDDLAKAAATQGRTVTADAKPERGLFYRADHFSLARRGVPTLLLMGIGGGADLVKGGRAAGDQWVSDYTAHCYHQTCDDWSADWDLTGAAQDVALVYRMGRDLANSTRWPSWKAGSEFVPIRAASRAAIR
ncbi:M20/M25/M40 family metallo-hydrolase [Sphingomonas sp. RT2P30]|uniref:M20/M25/M40 family metallo-hydrolase n=1 Tax=Parasphingomonas halimpatiens TaxID=3096162 RepID=UPI002FC6B955